MSRTRVRQTVWAVVGLVIVGVLSFTYAAYRRDIDQARGRVSTGSHMVQTPCGPIEYAVVGDGHPVLMVHGAGGGYDQVLDFSGPFIDHEFRVITMSRFGYLRTPLPADASPEAQADAHACLLDALGLERVVGVLGVSAGAPSAMQFALRHPARASRLVLLVPLAYAPRSDGPSNPAPSSTPVVFETALKSDFLFWLATKTLRRTLVKAILATPPDVLEHASLAEQTRARHMLHHILPVSVRQAGLSNDAKVASTLRRYDLERISLPTLTISFADDLYGTYESARYTAEHIPGARFIGYPSGGHVWIGHQEDVVSEILAFLK